MQSWVTQCTNEYTHTLNTIIQFASKMRKCNDFSMQLKQVRQYVSVQILTCFRLLHCSLVSEFCTLEEGTEM